MDAYRCDGCGVVSPDDEGNQIANHWSIVNLKTQINGYSAQYHLCLECMPIGENPHGAIRQIIDFFRRIFNSMPQD